MEFQKKRFGWWLATTNPDAITELIITVLLQQHGHTTVGLPSLGAKMCLLFLSQKLIL